MPTIQPAAAALTLVIVSLAQLVACAKAPHPAVAGVVEAACGANARGRSLRRLAKCSGGILLLINCILLLINCIVATHQHPSPCPTLHGSTLTCLTQQGQRQRPPPARSPNHPHSWVQGMLHEQVRQGKGRR